MSRLNKCPTCNSGFIKVLGNYEAHTQEGALPIYYDETCDDCIGTGVNMLQELPPAKGPIRRQKEYE